MRATLEQVQAGVHRYAEEELASKAHGLTKFGIYLVLPSVHRMVVTLMENPLAADFVINGNEIDLDKLRDRANDAMDHCGELDVAGFRFHKDDIASLYSYIERS